MRVYVPDKRDNLIKEALKELYLLRQEVDFGAGTPKSKIIMIDKIRSKLQDALEKDDQMFVIGELVRTISNYDFHTKRIGLVTEIKYLKKKKKGEEGGGQKLSEKKSRLQNPTSRRFRYSKDVRGESELKVCAASFKNRRDPGETLRRPSSGGHWGAR